MSEQGFEVLLSYLSPADTAAVRCVSRSWQVHGRFLEGACIHSRPLSDIPCVHRPWWTAA